MIHTLDSCFNLQVALQSSHSKNSTCFLIHISISAVSDKWYGLEETYTTMKQMPPPLVVVYHFLNTSFWCSTWKQASRLQIIDWGTNSAPLWGKKYNICIYGPKVSGLVPTWDLLLPQCWVFIIWIYSLLVIVIFKWQRRGLNQYQRKKLQSYASIIWKHHLAGSAYFFSSVLIN